MLVTWNEHGPPSAAVSTRVLAPHGQGTVGASAIRRTTGDGMAGLGQLRPVYAIVALAGLGTGCERVTYTEKYIPASYGQMIEPNQSIDGPPGRVAGRVTWPG